MAMDCRQKGAFANWLKQAAGAGVCHYEVEMRHWRSELLVDERLDGWAYIRDRPAPRAGDATAPPPGRLP